MNLSSPPGAKASRPLRGLAVPSLLSLFLLFPLIALLLPPVEAGRAVPGTVGIVVSGALFVVVVARNRAEPHSGHTPVLLAALVVTALVTLPFAGAPWLLAASYYLVAVGLLSQPRRRWPLVLLAVLAVDAAALVWLFGEPERLPAVLGQIALFGVLVGGLYWMAELSAELALARRRLARRAADEERLRVTRDLHDLLGHQLSGIVLRGELARRTLRGDPDRADAELLRITDTAREALAEVRRTLNGYRTVSLSTELGSARALLDGAGIELGGAEPPAAPLPKHAEGCAAWIVREGATNVLRHSGARRCRISVVSAADEVSVTVEDDGPAARELTGDGADVGREGGGGVEFGMGLVGLRERVEAEGGTLTVTEDAETFRLHATLPKRVD